MKFQSYSNTGELALSMSRLVLGMYEFGSKQGGRPSGYGDIEVFEVTMRECEISIAILPDAYQNNNAPSPRFYEQNSHTRVFR